MNRKLLPQKMSFFNLISLAVLFAFCSALFISCSNKDNSGPDKHEEKSTLKELSEVLISETDNPSLSEDAFVYKNNDELYITLPLGSDLSNVKVKFKVSPKASLSVDGKALPDLSGTLDLTKTMKVIVTSEAGTTQQYLLLAQKGIKELDKLFYEFKETYSIPGISFAISKTESSEIVYKSGIGFAIEEDLVRAQPDHLFRLGSVSKQFTSLLIMKLVQAKKLTAESTIFGSNGILKDEFSTVSEKAAKVTVRNLLDHSSGWIGDPDPMFAGGSFAGQTLEQLINYVLKSPQSEPGTKFSYFNMGYGILGKVIEKVSGKKYEVFLKEALAEAGITDIHVGGDKSERRSNEVIYYSQNGYNGYVNDMPVIAPAGGIIASTEQMLKLLTYIDGKDNVPDILTPEIRTMMLTPSQSSTYALGWNVGHRLYPDSWFHTGNLAGTATMWVMGPDINCVILCNSRSYLSTPTGSFDDNLYYLMADVITEAAKQFKD